MKFSELTKEAKKTAIKEYKKGWTETHPNEELSDTDAINCLMDEEDSSEGPNYNQEGEIL